MNATTGNVEAFRVVIPARCDSNRLPGKPLRMIGAKPLIRHVYDNACRSGAECVVVATDSEKVAACIWAAGGTAQMTSPDCASGSDRIAEAVASMQWPADAIVVNVQGDEPFLAPADVRTVANALVRFPGAAMATLSAPLAPEHRDDPNVVKVIADDRGMALAFSRAPIARDGHVCRRHLGIYAYRCGYLWRFTQWPAPDAERRERLEQLRALHHGDSIRVDAAASEIVLGIDTEDELREAEKLLGG